MENTVENKAKFFAQYWGQPCSGIVGLKNKLIGVEIPLNNIGWLELKPISSITDEDFMKIMWKRFPFQPAFKKRNIYHEHLNVNQADYLRSKGYALPYMGLTVEKLIEYGWVKIKEDKS